MQLFEAPCPLYGLDIEVLDDKAQILVAAGGGGSSKTGVPNRIAVHKLDTLARPKCSEITHYDPGPASPAIMCVASAGPLVAGGFDGEVRLFRYEAVGGSGRIKMLAKCACDAPDPKVKDDQGFVKEIEFTPDATQLVTGGEDGRVRVWSVPDLKPVRTFPKQNGEVNAIAIDRDGTHVGVVHKKELGVYSIQDGTRFTVAPPPDPSWTGKGYGAERLVFGADDAGRPLLFTLHGGLKKNSYLVQWSLTDETWSVVMSRSIGATRFVAMALSPDDETLALGDRSGNILFADARSLRPRRTVKAVHEWVITALAFTPDASYLVSSSVDRKCIATRVRSDSNTGLFLIIAILIIAILIVIAWLLVTLLSSDFLLADFRYMLPPS